MIREQHTLERRKVIKHLARHRALRLRVRRQRSKTLLLQRRETRIELVTTRLTRATRPRIQSIRSSERHIVHCRDRPPDIDFEIARS
jgi:hypothetical protein